MYRLLFRSRWYALAWALFMAASAVMFTTTGAGAWLTGTSPDPQASREAQESGFRSWAEGDKRLIGEDQGYDPSNPEHLRGDRAPQDALSDTEPRTAPLVPDETDEDLQVTPPPAL